MPIQLKNLSVLLIEDVQAMQELTKQALEGLGVGTVYTASDGHEGFKALRENDPDIVICDWDMPNCDGLEFLKEVRTNALAPNRMVPVIMVSGYSAIKRVVEARDSGMTEYMVKPFSAKDLAQRISYVINKPRDFVEVEEDAYIGPDRRRKQINSYKGKKRRRVDHQDG